MLFSGLKVAWLNQSPELFIKYPDKDFTRNRQLGFQKIMHLMLAMESAVISHELLKFFEYDNATTSSSAFIQQRCKLRSHAFEHLLKEFNRKFLLTPFLDDYFLIACDGSVFVIPRNPKNTVSYHPGMLI